MILKRFYNIKDINEALINIAQGNGYNNYATPIQLRDAVEDAVTAKELLSNLQKLHFAGWNNLSIDRETKCYVRIKGESASGIKYLDAEFERW